MCITHSLASGMGGVRTAGDLVARMQMSRNMKINEAKEYVASYGYRKLSTRKTSAPAVLFLEPLPLIYSATSTSMASDITIGRVESLCLRPFWRGLRFLYPPVHPFQSGYKSPFCSRQLLKPRLAKHLPGD